MSYYGASMASSHCHHTVLVIDPVERRSLTSFVRQWLLTIMERQSYNRLKLRQSYSPWKGLYLGSICNCNEAAFDSRKYLFEEKNFHSVSAPETQVGAF